MYRVTYEQGNGYRCGCCRRTWTEHEDFDTKEEVIEFLSKVEASKTISLYEDDDDIEIGEIREIKDEELYLEADPELTQKIIDQRKKDKEDKKKKEEQAQKRKQKRDDLKQLAELKAKYEKEV